MIILKNKLNKNKKGFTHQQTVLSLIFVTLVVVIGGTYITISAINNKLLNLGFTPITGFAVVPNGTATFFIQTSNSIKFLAASVDFGTGSVNTSGGFNNCSLITIPGSGNPSHTGNIGCSDFSTLSHGFVIENDGNTNLTVTIFTNRTAQQFIGSSTAGLTWNVTVNETSSCYNFSGVAGSETALNPNTTVDCGAGTANCGSIFEAVSTTPKTICPRLRFEDTNDALNLDINVTIPVDAPAGMKLTWLVATGTKNPP